MLGDALKRSKNGPGRIRTYDQGIHSAPMFPPGVDYLFTRAPGEAPREISRGTSRCVWVRDAPSLLSRALEPSGSLCTFRRCTGGSAQGCHGPRGPKVSLNSSRPLRAFPREGTSSMSPLH